MKSKTYFSKPNPDIEYLEMKDNLKQIVLELTLLVNRLQKLTNNKGEKKNDN
jgi:hypothetical protein